MNERIKKIRKASPEKTLERFGAKIGISGAAVSKIENGLTVPTRQTITAICSAYNVNEEWLRTGNGEMRPPMTGYELIMQRLAKVQLKITGDDEHGSKAAEFKRDLASAILDLDDEACEMFIKLLKDMGYEKRKRED